ncbi:unnamed protein product [Urochloa humidicola]
MHLGVANGREPEEKRGGARKRQRAGRAAPVARGWSSFDGARGERPAGRAADGTGRAAPTAHGASEQRRAGRRANGARPHAGRVKQASDAISPVLAVRDECQLENG